MGMRTTSRDAIVHLTTPQAPPAWALLERELLRRQSEACEAFYAHYFDERGYFLCTPRWGADDGPDDAAENLLNWPMLHALGAPDVVLALYKRGWEGHLRQYSEARTVESPLARDGMYYKEFPTMFDWFHHGEGFSAFFLQGLSDPDDRPFQRRTLRYAGFYLNEDPQAPNYDPEHRLIRSLVNGSRGPLLRQTTPLDWSGDPFEIEGRYTPRHGERSFQQMLERFEVRKDVIGDHPLNMGATTLAFNAYALTGEPKYRDWILDYLGAWVERTEANGGVLPTNIGLDGAIGGALGGRWWGGIYGWGFSFPDPTGKTIHYPFFQQRAHYSFANALLLTGDRSYLAPWRSTLDRVNANAKVVDGTTLYPHMYGAIGSRSGGDEAGWYEYRRQPFAPGALELYYWTLDRRLLDLLPARPRWIAFLDGDDPTYPEDALRHELEALRQHMEVVRSDTTTPDTRLSDEPHGFNPAIIGTLNQLMLGGLPTGRHGYPLHCRLRYFDPERRRAGLPEDVAALVERMTEDEVIVSLVNTNAVRSRTVVAQAGAYAEHHITDVTITGQTVPVDHSHVVVALAPGAGGRMRVTMQRYAHQPTFAFPWT
jgi:hypothetical protein